MDPVEKGHLHFSHVLCHRPVGGEHEFFNEAMGDVSLLPNDVQGLPLKIQDDLRLREIKVNAPLAHPHRSESVGQLLHEEKVPKEIVIPPAHARVPVY